MNYYVELLNDLCLSFSSLHPQTVDNDDRSTMIYGQQQQLLISLLYSFTCQSRLYYPRISRLIEKLVQ